MIDFNTVKEKAVIQLQDEWNELQDTLREDSESQRLADAIMNLRNLAEDSKFTLSVIMNDTSPESFLRDFSVIFDTNEFIRLPNAINSLVIRLRYNILDDGYLRIIKAVVEEDLAGKKTKTSKFFLTTDDDTYPVMLTIRKLKHDRVGCFDPKLISVKRTYFGRIEKFIEMLDVFGDKENWDSFDFIGEDKLEPLFYFNDERELLEKPVLLKS